MMGEVTYSYDIIDGKEIITRTFLGKISINDIINSFKFLQTENKITKHCVGIITDTSSSQLKIPISELGQIIRFLIRNNDIRKRKLALIANTPEKTIIPLIIAKRLPIIKVQPFSSKEAAIAWIMK